MIRIFFILGQNPRAAVRIGTGGDAPHTGEELKGPRGPNRPGGPKILLD